MSLHAGCDVAFKSDSFTRAVYKGLVEITLVEANQLPNQSDAAEKLLTGNGADLYVLFIPVPCY